MSSYVRLRQLLAGIRGTALPYTGVLPAGTTLQNAFIFTGTGSPAGALAAPVGSIYIRTDGAAATTLYLKTSGAATSAGWTVVTSA